MSGWRKTERYELVFARENRLPKGQKTIPDPPKYLTMVRAPLSEAYEPDKLICEQHYFDGESLPVKELARAGESEWTQRIMAAMQEAQIVAFRKLSHHRRSSETTAVGQ